MVGSEVGQEFILFGAGDFGFPDAGGVTFHFDGLSRFEDDVGLREVRIEQGGEDGAEEFAFIDELTVLNADGIDSLEAAFVAVDVELGVVDVFQFSFKSHSVFSHTAGCEQERGCQKESGR